MSQISTNKKGGVGKQIVNSFYPVFSFFKMLNFVIKKIEEFILGMGVIGLFIITAGNVVSRKFFNYSWTPTEEVSQFILVIVTFMGVSYAVRKNRHIHMTAVYEIFSQKGRKILMLIISFVTCLILFYLAYYALDYILYVKKMGRVTPALRIPFYLVTIWAPIGLALSGIQYAIVFVKNIIHKEIWSSSEAAIDDTETIML